MTTRLKLICSGILISVLLSGVFFRASLTRLVTTHVTTQSVSNHSFVQKRKSSMSTFLFRDNKTKDILDCITGEVVGVRPRHVAMVDVHQLRLSDHDELDRHRKAVFSNIFHERAWGQNSKVGFSASGKPICIFFI